MSKIRSLNRIKKTGIVAIVRIDNFEKALKIVESIKAGDAVGVGSSLTAGAEKNDYEEITRTAEEFIRIIKRTREVL